MSTTLHQPAADATFVDPKDQLLAGLRRLQKRNRDRGAPTYEERRRSIERLKNTVLARKAEIARAIDADFGHRSTYETYIGDVMPIVNGANYVRAHLKQWMEGESRKVHWAFLPARARVVKQPLGVVGIISPWNYPFNLSLGPLVDVLAAGNRAMIKPSELTPASSDLLATIVRETFDPDDVKVVIGDADVGNAFAHLPFDHLVFTGSTKVGKLVMKAAAENLVPVTLELGGKSPALIGETHSMDKAAESIAFGKCFNAGQTCIAPDYVLVPEARRDEFVASFTRAVAAMYPTLRDNADYTNIVNAKHHARLRKAIDEARTQGAKMVEINPASESFEGTRKIPPTLALDASEWGSLAINEEEIFGPILPVHTYRSFDDALDYINDRPRPLALYLYEDDKARQDRVIAETHAGGVGIGETVLHFAQDDLPFGGIGPSGMGHYHGREGFETFTKTKAIFEQSKVNAMPLIKPPYGRVIDALMKVLLR